MKNLGTDYKIQDIIDIEKISRILESFSKLTNIATAILDLDGNIIIQTGWREICSCFHRKNSETAQNCNKSDTVLASKLAEGVKYNVYECINGLIDIAVPIVIRGNHVGNLFTGQFLFEPPDIEAFREQAVKFDFNTEEYLNALKKVPVIDESQVKDIVSFLLNVTEMLGETGLNNIRQIETNKDLEISKSFNETLLNTSPDVIYVYDIQSKSNVYSNEGIRRILGYSISEIKEMGSELIQNLMHKDDFDNYITTIVPRYLSAENDEFIEHDYRMKHKNGDWLWLHSREKVFLRNSQGVPIQVFGIISDITKSKKTHEEISKIQTILEETGKLAKVGGWEFEVASGKGTWTNEVAIIHDLNPEEPTSVELALEFYTPNSRQVIEKAINLAISQGKPYDLELEIISAKGKHKWVRTIGRAIKEAGVVTKLTGSFQDITNIKKFENQLKENSNFLDTIIEDAAVSMWISDEDGTAIKANSACLELFGAKREEVIGKYNIFKDNVVDKMGFMPLVETVFKEGEIADFTIDYSLAEVEHVDVQYATHKIIRTIITPVFGLKNEVAHAIIQSIDLTEIKKTEKELTLAKEKAEESDKLKTAFLANMSHEIRTPMNGILGFADLLKKPDLTDEQLKKYVNIIEQSGKRMLNIISDLIDISKIETGQVEVINENIDLNKILEDLLLFFRPVADKQGLILEFESETIETKCIIVSDRTKLNQVLTNLVGNALKFTKKGQVSFSYKLENNKVLFYVKDTGIGISVDVQEKIFERFIQGDLSPADASDGSGLGLAISKAYIELMGGNLWVESELDKGSTFYFSLPYRELEKGPGTQKMADSVLEHLPNELQILIAEDDEISYMYLQEILDSSRIKISHVTNGKEAIEYCNRNHSINLVLMDIKMPVLNGLEATRLIKRTNPTLPIIAQSAYITQKDKEIAFRAGCDDYIEKPIEKTKLYTMINKHVK